MDGTTDTNQPAWSQQLPEDLKGNEAFTGFEKLGDFAQDYLSKKGSVSELEGKLSNSVAKLGEGATSDEVKAFYRELGAPEDAKGYELNKRDAIEGLAYDDKLEAAYRETALSLGLSKQQAAKLYDWYSEVNEAVFTNAQQSKETSLDESVENLKKSWGAEYDAKLEKTKKAVAEFGGDELKTLLDESGLGNNPIMIEAFHKIGAAMSEDKLISGGTTNTMTSSVDPMTGRALFSYANSPDMNRE